MAPSISSVEPARLTAGNTWEWTRSFGTYPISEGWALSYRLNGRDVLEWDPNWITDDGTTHTIRIPATATQLAAGRYEWVALVTGSGAYDGRRYEADRGVLIVDPDPANADDGDRQTHAEKMVCALEAAIQGRATDDILAYTLPNGRSVQMSEPGELTKWLSHYKAKVWKERHPGQALPGLTVRFGATH